MEFNLADSISLPISIAATSISIITFLRMEKRNQFRIGLEINDKLEKAVNELLEVITQSRNNKPDDDDDNKNKQKIRSKALEYLNILNIYLFS